VFVCVWLSVIRGCYIGSVNNELQIYNVNIMCICVCVGVCGDRGKEDYSSWRESEDGGK